jgi:hypothetical protein
MPSLKQIIARDRRFAAIHEAGHVIMARHLGALVASAWLEKTGHSDVLFQRQWIGHTSCHFNKPLSRRKKIMFAVAGAVAEKCWERIPFDETVDDWYEPNVMSESDWAGTGCTAGNPSSELWGVIDHVFSLFDPETGRLWPELIKEARNLIVKTRKWEGGSGSS